MEASRKNAKPTLLRRVLACLVSAAMVVAFTPVVAWGESGDVTYLDTNGNQQTCTSATEVEDSVEQVTWSAGWYVVQGSNVTISQRVTVSGNVSLILADGCKLTVNGGIQVQDNDNNPSNISTNSLTIYGQSDGTGELIADATVNYSVDAGIGSSGSSAGGNVTICGGIVMATSTGNAGIGGGDGGIINITGGTVTATSTNGAGIGSSGSGKVNINGGTVTATSTNGAGIGGLFDTGTYGKAVVFASSISDKTYQSGWHGIICEGSSSDPVFYGTSATPTDSFTIPTGKTLTIPTGKTLTIKQGVTLTNEGIIANCGTINNFGTITNANAARLDNSGSINNCGVMSSVTSGNPSVDLKATASYRNAQGGIDNHECIAIDAGHISCFTTLYSGWYVVKGTVGANTRIVVDGDVHLILEDGCSLTVNGGIVVSGSDSLTIYGQSTDENAMGKLIANGDSDNAGIGGGGTVTITGGTVTATGGTGGAGIGGGVGGKGGTVTITGGTVTATGGTGGAGIGGGVCGSNGDGGGGEITISGGTVIATSDSGAGIGGGAGASLTGTFSTTESGNAAVFASSISDKRSQGSWSGVIFEGDSGSVYGNPTLCSDLTFPTGAGSVASTMAKNLTVPSGSTLTIAEGKTLTVPSGSTLSNEGSIYVDGTLDGEGTVSGSGAVYYPLTLDADGGTINSGDIKYYNSKTDTTLPTPTKSGYTFAGWYNGNSKVEKIDQGTTGPLKLTAKWTANYAPPATPQASADCIKLINALPDVDAITLEDGEAIEAARSAYEALTDYQKSFVPAASVTKLEAAEQRYGDLVAVAPVEAALDALPQADKLKTSQAKAAVKKAKAALEMVASLTDGQKALVDEALIANAQEVVVKGAVLIAKADKKAVGKVKNKAFSVRYGTSKSIYFKTLESAAGTKVTYKKASGSSYITVTKAGKVTARQGMKEDKTYTAKIKVTCGKSWKYVKVTVKVRG